MTRDEALLRPFVPTDERPWDRAAAAHLARRAALHEHPALCAALIAEPTPQAAVTRLLAGDPPGDEELAHEAALAFVLAADEPRDLAAWCWMQCLLTSHPLRARMTLLWHDHFATGIDKVASARWMAEQWRCLGEHGLGSFATLCEAVAKGPAMLRWLDGETNEKGRANENFARELFELFTLGRDQGYDEHDVKEAARSFTGWSIRKGSFWFDRSRHDAGTKRVLGSEGLLDGDAVLALAVGHEACARHIAGKLCAAFVGPACPTAAVDELAAVYRAHEGRIDACLEVLLGSELFFDPATRRARIRGPIEWVLWTLRTLGLRASPRALHRAAARMGQELLEPPDVSGWDEEEAWISSATWIHRQNFAARLASPEATPEARPPLAEVVPVEGAEAEYRWLSATLFPDGLPVPTAAAIEARLPALDPLPRERRLALLAETLWMLPEAHRF